MDATILTTAWVADPSGTLPNRLADASRVGPLCLMLLFGLISTPFAPTPGRQHIRRITARPSG